MDIRFFENPLEEPKAREDVRIRRIGLHIYPDMRRMMFGLELTPFRERPSVEVAITNGAGEPAGSLHVIENLRPNFSLILHLRDVETTNPYTLTAVIYYSWPEQEEKQLVDRQDITFEVVEPGELIFEF